MSAHTRRRLDRRPPLLDHLERRMLLSIAGATPASVAAVAEGPDLTVRFKRVPRAEIVGGMHAKASLVIANRRPATVRAQPTTVGVYFSSDATLDGGDRALGTVPVGARLRPGQRVVRAARITFPADLASGAYHLLARVDEPDSNAEVDEANNVADGGTIAYAAPVFDIVPLALKNVRLYFYRGLGIGGTATLYVRNGGNTDFVGTISGTVNLVHAPNSLYNTSVTYSQQVTIRRGARKTIDLRPELLLSGSMMKYVCTATADAPADATSGQSVEAPAELILRDWFGRESRLP